MASSQRRPLDPRAYEQIVGKTFANLDHRPLITIGKRQWNRWQLGRLGCPHPVAALRVNRVIQTLQISSPAEFIALADAFKSYKEIGVTSYWVVLALLYDLGEDIEEAHGDGPSFHTVHRKVLQEGTNGKRHYRKRPLTVTSKSKGQAK